MVNTNGDDKERDELIVGRYRIIQSIGHGGLGRVYLAQDKVFERHVVLKTVELSDDRAQALLLRESRLLAGLDHPTLARVYDTVIHNGVVYLILEYIEGQPLSSIQKSGPLSHNHFMDIYTQIGRALEFLHARGVLHRDLKPQNVLISPNGNVKIVDFGLAVALDERDSLTQQGTVVGTPAYMSPEVVRGVQVGPQADIFSLGIMMFESLTGENPYQGSLAAMLSVKAAGAVPADFKEKLAGTDYADLITRMLSPDPADRPTSTEVVGELERIKGGKPSLTSHLDRDTPVKSRPAISIVSLVPAVILLAAFAIMMWWFRNELLVVVALAGGGLLFVVGHGLGRQSRVRQHDPLPITETILNRIAAMERRVRHMDAVSESLAISVGDLQSELSSDKLKDIIHQSVMIALQDLKVGEPATDVGRAIGIISDLTRKKGKDPWYTRTSALMTAGGAAVAIIAGIIGVVMTTKVWQPNTPPHIIEIHSSPARAIRTKPFEISVSAEDGDGEALDYAYQVDEGNIKGKGPVAIWQSDSTATSDVISVMVRVSDGHATVTQSKSFRVNRPPVYKLNFPKYAVGGTSVRLGTKGSDPDGDTVTFKWQVSGGALSEDSAEAVLLTVPEVEQKLIVICTAFDGWESVELSGEITVVRKGNLP